MCATIEIPVAKNLGSLLAPLILFLKSSGNTPQTDDIFTPTFSNKFPCKILLTPPPKPSELSFFHLFCLKVFF